MKIKKNINQGAYEKIFGHHNNNINSINKFYFPYLENSNYISLTELLKNNMKKEYKTSFIQNTFINDGNSKDNNNNNQKIYQKSNSRTNGNLKKKINNDSEIKREKFKTKFIKEIILDLENSSIYDSISKNSKKDNKYNSHQKNEYIKKKFLDKIKNSNIIYIPNKKEVKYKYFNKNINMNDLHEYNTSRGFFPVYNNYNSNYNNSDKNSEIKKNNNILMINKDKKNSQNINIEDAKNGINEIKPINNYKKIKLNITERKLVISPKRESNMSKEENLKTNEIKKLNNNKELSSITINEHESKMTSIKRNFLEKDIPSKYYNFLTCKNTIELENENRTNSYKKCHYYPSFIESNIKGLTKFNTNKKKLFIKNRKNSKKGNYSNSFVRKHSSKGNIIFDTSNSKRGRNTNLNDKNKNKDLPRKNIDNKDNKNNIKDKNLISKKHSKYLGSLYLKEEKKDKKKINIIKLNKKKPEKDNKNEINYIHQTEDKKIDNINEEELNFVLDIESENKNVINLIKTNKFDVNKPKENNMKFTLLKDLEDEEDNKEINKSQIGNIIIGEIEGYRDIIESDKINKNLNLRSKSSLDIHNEKEKKLLIKRKFKRNTNCIKNLKTFTNDKKIKFLNIHILEDNSNEIEDLEYENNNNMRINGQWIDIENEYEFEDMTTYENETKINNDNNNLIPFHESKISFCHYYDKNHDQYKPYENNDTDITSLVLLNKELNKLDYKLNYINKKRIIMNNNNNLKNNKVLKYIKKNNIINNNYNNLNLKNSPKRNNNYKTNINNNVEFNNQIFRSKREYKNLNLNKNNIIKKNKNNNNKECLNCKKIQK